MRWRRLIKWSMFLLKSIGLGIWAACEVKTQSRNCLYEAFSIAMGTVSVSTRRAFQGNLILSWQSITPLYSCMDASGIGTSVAQMLQSPRAAQNFGLRNLRITSKEMRKTKQFYGSLVGQYSLSGNVRQQNLTDWLLDYAERSANHRTSCLHGTSQWCQRHSSEPF